jgi:TolA-binding protein
MDPELDDAGAPIEPAEARAEGPAEAPLPPASAPRGAASQEAGAVGRDAALAAERALLETARAALARGQRAAAFDALTKHAQAFPRGRLGEERDGLFIQALISAGRIDEAHARLARFRRSYPRSMLLQAFDASLRADSETDEEGSSQ